VGSRVTKSIDDYPTDGFPIPWATWIPDRRPEFKVHSDLGKAKNAIGMPIPGAVHILTNGTREQSIRGGVLYQLIKGKWTVRAVVSPGTWKSEHMLYTQPSKWNKHPGITTVIEEHPYEA
jgi:hypothetical protein